MPLVLEGERLAASHAWLLFQGAMSAWYARGGVPWCWRSRRAASRALATRRRARARPARRFRCQLGSALVAVVEYWIAVLCSGSWRGNRYPGIYLEPKPYYYYYYYYYDYYYY